MCGGCVLVWAAKGEANSKSKVWPPWETECTKQILYESVLMYYILEYLEYKSDCLKYGARGKLSSFIEVGHLLSYEKHDWTQ